MEIASEIGIPIYYFFTSGVAVLSLYSYFPKIHTETMMSFRDMVGVEIIASGNAVLSVAMMSGPVLDMEDHAYEKMLYFCELLSTTKGIMVNTFYELEVVAFMNLDGLICLSWSFFLKNL